MPDQKAYWAAVREQESKLPPVVYITSLPPEQTLIPNWVGGRVFTADAALAAKRLTERTHRPATEEEIKRFHVEMEARNAACRAQTAANEKKVALTIDAELAKRLRVGK
jgi:hypothetical protein